jgi:hypothetical protein
MVVLAGYSLNRMTTNLTVESPARSLFSQVCNPIHKELTQRTSALAERFGPGGTTIRLSLRDAMLSLYSGQPIPDAA